MPNINQRQKRINLIRKRKLGKKMEKAQWFIGKSINQKTFYVAEHDAKENTTMWSPNRRESITFPNERSANKYIMRYLHSRTDVILVNVQTK
jgi:hypothetical protein